MILRLDKFLTRCYLYISMMRYMRRHGMYHGTWLSCIQHGLHYAWTCNVLLPIPDEDCSVDPIFQVQQRIQNTIESFDIQYFSFHKGVPLYSIDRKNLFVYFQAIHGYAGVLSSLIVAHLDDNGNIVRVDDSALYHMNSRFIRKLYRLAKPLWMSFREH